MKTAQKGTPANTKHSPANTQANGEKGNFFSRSQDAEHASEQPFFENTPIRRKMTVNEPGDHFEKQADQVADHVVQQLSAPKPAVPAAAQSVAVQKKEEKQEDKQEKEQSNADKELQRQPIFDSDADPNEGDTLKRSGESAAPDVSAQTQQRIESSKGGGEPLPANTREEMESAMGADLSSVRIHHDSEAAGLSHDLKAQAFTHGNDVYFGSGKYDTQSASGQHLLAHELAHTQQQGAAAKRKETPAIQRDGTAPAGGAPAAAPAASDKVFSDPAIGSIDVDTKKIELATLKVPAFKRMYHQPGLTVPRNATGEDRPNNQISVWKAGIRSEAEFNAKLDAKIQRENPPAIRSPSGTPLYYMKLKRANNYVIGSRTDIRNAAVVPSWNISGSQVSYDVDHKKELQLGGLNAFENFWLFDSDANQSSGRNINGEFVRAFGALKNAAKASINESLLPADLPAAKQGFEIKINQFAYNLPFTGNPENVWQSSEVTSGLPLDGLNLLTAAQIEAAGLRGRSAGGTVTQLTIMSKSTGGSLQRVPWHDGDTSKEVSFRFGQNFHVTNVNYTIGSGGSITGIAFRDPEGPALVDPASLTFQIIDSKNVDYGGYVSEASVQQQVASILKLKGMSPIVLQQTSFDENGISGVGKVLPTIKLFEGADVDIVINGSSVRLRKIFNGNEIKLPPPFAITNTSLQVFVDSAAGFGAEGNLQFEIANVGKGSVTASASTGHGFAVRGTFELDPRYFDSNITVAYANDQLTVEGNARIGAGKIKGIKSASLHFNYENNVLTANGTAESDIKGIKSAALNVSFGNNQLVIGGSFVLDENIPGIQSGSGTAQLTRGADGIYHVTASGTAVPKIPKINTSLSINYDDGALTLEGTAAYTADRVSGDVKVGATNRAIAPDGTLTGPAGEHFSAYGSGSLTLKVTDWLQATAAVRVTPAGEIEVVGRLELPSSVDVFPRKSINKNLFRAPTIEIPLFAIPLGPRSIGLVATINGGLDFEAGVGPGQLRNVFGQIEFNPSHPENTRISGGAEFVIPANAGIKLHADLGIGLSIGVASVTGGVEIRGGLGLEGEAKAQADLAWSPTTGFEFNALGEIEVHPKFTFDVNALLRASLDLGLFDISKEWRHNLASFSFGPEMQLKVSLPVHYKDGEPFDVKTDDIKVTYPDISISEIAGGIADKVKNEML
ncbi:protein of unknown function [Mucilaginibacter pineti]|uniref:eCIS core domain-containing protein n=1 Tax=Mucilaginibacter pineti TaxID=1391627 RepID=A0A1G6WPB1_9SPHI|nr:DUF4157 domain-containing protein [Mucilaginibacter pineti]SDD67780.1 protein of unknown function [Mucilaginibacter pineti]